MKVATDPVVTIPATVVSTPSAALSTTMGVPTTTEAGSSGGPSVATEGFCVDLAAESGRLTVQVERLVRAGDGNEARNLHALLSASGDLLAWAVEAACATDAAVNAMAETARVSWVRMICTPFLDLLPKENAAGAVNSFAPRPGCADSRRPA